MNNGRLLTFEWDDKLKCVEIHFNDKGLETFIESLKGLEQSGGDIHLFTKKWGGRGLDSEKQGDLNQLINHVKIIKWE